jgi:hypothetical protein
VNDLPFSYVDAEHFLCKGWILVKKTFGSYRNSKYPNSLEAHLHPIKWPDDPKVEYIATDEDISKIMQMIADQLVQCRCMEANEEGDDDNDDETEQLVLPAVYRFDTKEDDTKEDDTDVTD